MNSIQTRNFVTTSFKSSNQEDFTKLFIDNRLRSIFYQVLDAIESEQVTLTGGALVGIETDLVSGTFYGTSSAPATSGDLEASSSNNGVVGGKAIVFYQAVSAPTITGITDIDVASSWDNVNVNIIEVLHTPGDVLISRHLGAF